MGKRILLVLALAGVVAATTPGQARPAPRQAPARDYVVLYAKGASLASARLAVRAAGGTIVRENTAVGVATATSLDPRFEAYRVDSAAVECIATGYRWAEGPVWFGDHRCLLWSDIPNNVQMRWIEEDGHVTTFRNPSGYSNGNTFDYEGRQLSCEHGNRRVARYEPNGAVTVVAEKFQGKRLNSPNDIVVSPDGGIWFTDPGYGIFGNYEGHLDQSELPPRVYRLDPKTGQATIVADSFDKPNGLAFSPD